LEVCLRTGALAIEPFSLGLLAEAYALACEPVKGLLVLQDAFASAESSGETAWNAELHRVHADLLRRSSDSNLADIEASFRAALSTARDQGARGYELRATNGLSRFYGDQGRQGDARDVLAPVYHWFTEGFDMADLKEARALLKAFEE
jgi:predicted ATPase